MKIEKRTLAPKDLIFGVFCFMQASMLRSGYIISITHQDSWAMTICGFLLCLPLLGVYALLLKKFPGKNLLEMNRNIYGTVLGKVVSALYLFHFITLAALNTRDVGNFVVDFLMPETPFEAILLICLIGCVYALRKSPKSLMYLAVAIGLLMIGSVSINSILVLKDIQPGFLKPSFQLEPMKYVQGAVSVTAVPMAEIITFMMFTPMLKKEGNPAKPLFRGLLLSTVVMTALVIRDIITLGPMVSIVSLPSFESVRYISLSGVLTRMENTYAVVLIFLFLFKVSLLLYAFALGLTQLLNKKCELAVEAPPPKHGYDLQQAQPPQDHPPLLLISAALVFFFSLFLFESVMENMSWGATAAPFYSLTMAFVLPLISLIVASIRKLDGEKEAAS